MVPVLDSHKKPLMPCTEKRARKLLQRGDAKVFWQQGIFCIILQREPSERDIQPICVAIDPGSKRTGITVATQKRVVCNMLFNTPHWVKDNVELRRVLRRGRRNRKTPYRKCRYNRKIGGIPPSTKARWQAHLRVVNVWCKISPISHVVIEDVKAVTKKGQRKWNVNFSPLEVGKKWFSAQVVGKRIDLTHVCGFETKCQRDLRGFKKTKSKLSDVWEAHNVDSHCLVEILWSKEINPFRGLLRCNFLRWHRRKIHYTNFSKSGIRRKLGTTRSIGIKRGTLYLSRSWGLYYIGGNRLNLISGHCAKTGERIYRNIRKENVGKYIKNLKWTCSLLHAPVVQ